MSSRISSFLPLLLCLSACSVKGDEDQGAQAQGEAGKPVGIAAPRAVPCALDGAKQFKQDCAIERFERDGTRYVVVRHPDGGFRRLVEHDSGRRFDAADGAETAVSTPNAADLEVTVGDDHYLFPNPAQADAPH